MLTAPANVGRLIWVAEIFVVMESLDNLNHLLLYFELEIKDSNKSVEKKKQRQVYYCILLSKFTAMYLPTWTTLLVSVVP